MTREINPLQKALRKIFDREQWSDRRHLETYCQMVTGLIQSGSCHLTDWIPFVFSRAKFAQSHQRRFHRWLENRYLQVNELYGPLIQEALSDWQAERLYLALDTSVLWDKYCLVSLAVVYRGRAVPLIWQVLAHPSAMIAFQHYERLLRQSVQWLPAGVEIVLLGDRGFADIKLMNLCTELGWHYRLRIKENFNIYQEKEYVAKVNDYPLGAGQSLFIHNARLTDKRFGPVHIALANPAGVNERWAIVSDELTTVSTFDEYGYRFDTEEFFLDIKSNGFQLESSKLDSAEALTRLLFVFAGATLFLVSQGNEVVANEQRRLVDPHWFRGTSYFRIGWQWVHAAISHGWTLIKRLLLDGRPDPEPTMASKRQRKQCANSFIFEYMSLNLKE